MFAEKLKKLRGTRNLTQEEFAKEINVTKGAVAMWETGKRTPDLAMIKNIAAYFNVSVDELVGNSVDRGVLDDTDENLVILNRKAKKLSPEKRKRLLDMVELMFEEDFNE